MEGEVVVAVEGTVEIPAPTFSLFLLSVVKAAQKDNGWLHGDYQRYRHFCTNRVRRLRHSLRSVYGKSSSLKFAAVRGHSKVDPRLVHLALFSAERAWGYAMELKGVYVEEQKLDDGNLRVRHGLIARLRKAEKWAGLVQELCGRIADERTTLEAAAYWAFMRGILCVELEQWADGAAALAQARKVYGELGKLLAPEQRAVYEQRVLEEISPNLRFCEYNLGSAGSRAAADHLSDLRMRMAGPAFGAIEARLEKVLADSDAASGATCATYSWKGTPLGVASEKVLERLRSAETGLASVDAVEQLEQRMMLFDRVLSDYADALGLVRDAQVRRSRVGTGAAARAAAAGAAAGAAAAGAGAVSSDATAARLCEMVTYLRLAASVRRTEMLVEATARSSKPGELVRLYDSEIQQRGEMLDILRDQPAHPDVARNEAALLVARAHRCFYLATALSLGREFYKAQVLCDRATAHLDHVPSAATAAVARAAALRGPLQALAATLRARAVLANLPDATAQTGAASSFTAAAALDRFHLPEVRGGEVVLRNYALMDFPPALRAMPVKPVLFDLAYPALEYPSLESHLPAAPAKAAASGRSWLGSWWRG